MGSNLRDIAPCDCGQNQYELDVVETLIEWLTGVTGILWISAYPNSSQPGIDDFNSNTTQYGTVHVDTMEVSKSGRQTDSHKMNNDSDECVTVSKRVLYGITLTVYNHVKMPKNACRGLKTAGDVLLRVFDAYYEIPRLRKCLTDHCMEIQDQNVISNSETRVGNSYERGASVYISLMVLRTTSFAKDLIKLTS